MKKIFTFLTLVFMLSFTSQAAYYIVGNDPFGNWDPANGVEMTQNADGTYGYTATINGSVWFVFSDGLDADWNVFNANYRIGPVDNTADEVVEVGIWYTTQKAPEGGKSYKFTGSGDKYVFTFNPFANKFKIEGNVDIPPIEVYTVAGEPATVFGTLWDPNNTENDMVLQENGMYQLDKLNCALGAGSELQFKVVGNRDWGNAWPDENRTLTVDQSGIYNLRFTFDPNTTFCGVQASMVQNIDPRTGDLFILGEVNGNAWGPNIGLQMTTEDNNIYKATFTTNGENFDETDGIGYSYFSFTTLLGEDWGSIAGYRIGAISENYLLTEDQMGIELQLGGYATNYSYKIPAGEYEATVNLDAMTLVITKVGGEMETTATPVISYEVTDDEVIITVTGDGEVHVYVDGVEVENPYIIPRGDEDVTVTVTATAQEEGKLISETATEEITVPAKEVVEPSEYTIEPLWDITDLSFLTAGDVRQGFGMNGKFYINDKANQKVIVIDENGLLNTEYPGGANCGITRDEAGNLVISNAHFPDAWTAESTIIVVDPETNEMKEYVVPEECGMAGRCDFIGFAKGDMMEDGVIYMTGATNTGISVMTIAGGEVSVDDCYVAPCDGLTPSTSTVINYFTDLAGEEALLYVTRNAALTKITFDGEEMVPATMTLPNKSAHNGTFPFIWDEKEFFVYPTLPNYFDGFAVAEAGAEAPIVEIAATYTANANAFTSNWLNAEVCKDNNDKEYVTIYQYYPGGYLAVYMLYKGDRPEIGGIEELINDSNKVVASKRYYNIMGQEMSEANGVTIIVTTYTDGSRSAAKVIK